MKTLFLTLFLIVVFVSIPGVVKGLEISVKPNQKRVLKFTKIPQLQVLKPGIVVKAIIREKQLQKYSVTVKPQQVVYIEINFPSRSAIEARLFDSKNELLEVFSDTSSVKQPLSVYSESGGKYRIEITMSASTFERQTKYEIKMSQLSPQKAEGSLKSQIKMSGINYHAFSLNKGQFVFFDVIDDGRDLNIKVFDPENKKISRWFDESASYPGWYNSMFGSKLSFEAKKTGIYTFQIDNSIGSDSSYEIKFLELPDLKIGQTQLGEVKVRKFDSYGIQLKAGQILHFNAQIDDKEFLEAKRIDPYYKDLLPDIHIYDTNGNWLQQVRHNETGDFQFIAPDSGKYRIEIGKKSFDVKLSDDSLSYKIDNIELRNPSVKEEIDTASLACPQDVGFKEHQLEISAIEILKEIYGCMEAVSARIAATHPDIVPLVSEAQRGIKFMISRDSWDGVEVPPLYLVSLGVGYDVLENAARQPDKKKIYLMIKEVAEDLIIKADSCRRSIEGLGSDSEVTITTMRNKEMVSGWMVFFKPSLFMFSKDVPQVERFPHPSNPNATRNISPGKYIIWAETSNSQNKSKEDTMKIEKGVRQFSQTIFVP